MCSGFFFFLSQKMFKAIVLTAITWIGTGGAALLFLMLQAAMDAA